jgi:hypothetical protein
MFVSIGKCLSKMIKHGNNPDAETSENFMSLTTLIVLTTLIPMTTLMMQFLYICRFFSPNFFAARKLPDIEHILETVHQAWNTPNSRSTLHR